MDLYLFSSTHWDREWYKPFQGFRYKLVQMVDDLLDGLETVEDYGVFHFDGQTIVLEDYLEIVPENRERIRKLIEAGKLRVGPWYNMPDEFNVSGESLIKNLRRGYEIARQFGAEPMKLGYVCDIFGHTAQMPQIFRQFGIEYAALGRGTNECNTPMYFIWEGADSSQLLTWKLNDPYGYGTLSVNDCKGDPLEDEAYREKFHQVMERELGRTHIPLVILTDGQDHIPMRRDSSKYLKLIRELYPQMQTHHEDVERALEKLQAYRSEMPLRRGELNQTSKGHGGLLTGCVSSRFDIKSANDRLEQRLEKLVSPLMALGLVSCRPGFLKVAETYLLQCHPHDSICGCSVAQVHQDMKYRFDQANMIASEIEETFMNQVREGMFGQSEPANDGTVVLRVYNPLPYPREGVQTLKVEFAKNYPYTFSEGFGYEFINSFKIYDTMGREIPYGIADIQKGDTQDVYILRLSATLIPMGVTEFQVVPSQERSRYLERMVVTSRGADNGIIAVQMNADGSINLTDHRSGRTYENLLTLLDDADIGDGWYHCGTIVGETVTNSSAVLSIAENTVNAVTMKIKLELTVPAGVDFHDRGMRRSEKEEGKIYITHRITLLRDSDKVHVKTTVDNQARDHRLKLRLPTGIDGESYHASLPFCFVERKTGVDLSTAQWLEVGVAEKQNHGVVYKADEEGGLAFISRYAFHECAVYENGDIDMTMMRCFSKTPAGREDAGELLGKWEMEYDLCPFVQEAPDAMLQRAHDSLTAPVLCATAQVQKAMECESLVSLEGDTICFSTADLCDGKRCLRFYNPTDELVSDVLYVKDMVRASSIRLDGTLLEEIPVEDSCLTLTLRPYEIFTVAVENEK